MLDLVVTTPATSTDGSKPRGRTGTRHSGIGTYGPREEPPDRFEGAVFPRAEDETSTYDKQAGPWYRHRFYRFEPDLQYLGRPGRALVDWHVGEHPIADHVPNLRSA